MLRVELACNRGAVKNHGFEIIRDRLPQLCHQGIQALFHNFGRVSRPLALPPDHISSSPASARSTAARRAAPKASKAATRAAAKTAAAPSAAADSSGPGA